jgi:signal transduction histidine kinase
MIYGFVKQSHGHVTIASEVGQGTTVHLYLPMFEAAKAPAPMV